MPTNNEITEPCNIIEKVAETNAAIFDILMLICTQIRIQNPELASNIESLLKELSDSALFEKSESFSGLSSRAQLALSGGQELWFQSFLKKGQEPLNPEPLKSRLSVIKGGLCENP